MLEFLFFLYLTSGQIKGLLLGYGVQSPIDITLLTGVLVLAYSLFRQDGEGLKERFISGMGKGRPLIILLVAFFIWSLFSTLFLTPSADYAYWKYIALSTDFLAFVVPLIDPRLRLRVLVGWMCGFAVLYGVFTFFAYGLRVLDSLSLMGLSKPDLLERLYMKAGLYLGVSGILAFLFRNWKGLLLMNGLFLLLVGTAARGPILFFVIILPTLYFIHFFLYYKKGKVIIGPLFPKARAKWLLGILAANILVITLIASNDLLRAPYERTLVRYELLLGVSSEDPQEGVDSETAGGEGEGSEERPSGKTKRLNEYEFALAKIVEDPYHFIFGYGFGSFNKIMYGKDKRGYPHNVMLEVWFELGSIGLLIVISFLVSALYRAYQLENWILLFAVSFILLNTMKSYSIVDMRILFGLLGIAAFIPMKSQEQSSSEGVPEG